MESNRWIFSRIIALGATGVVITFLAGMRLLVHQVLRLDPSRVKVRMETVDACGTVARFRENKYTAARGLYRVTWETGSATVGEVLEIRRGHVIRRISAPDGAEPPKRAVVDWSGQYFQDPATVGAYVDVQLRTQFGGAPAWLFPGADSNDTWVIHIHGSRVTRRSPLRGVAALAGTGVHSLVVAYRGDGEGPAHPLGASSLGLSEWQDLEPALAYAKDHGARRIVLMGWSMGGTIALLAAEHSVHRDAIAGLILIGPVTDWRRAILHGARSAKLPSWLGKSVVAVLGTAGFARLVGVRKVIDLDSLNWTRRQRLDVPCLVLHSEGDDEVPFLLSEEFASVTPTVSVETLPRALHTMEWNRSPEAFSAAITQWLQRID